MFYKISRGDLDWISNRQGDDREHGNDHWWNHSICEYEQILKLKYRHYRCDRDIFLIRYESARPEPDLRCDRHPRIEFIIHVAGFLFIIFIALLIVAVCRMTPPSIKQKAEEEWEHHSCIEIGGMNVEYSIPLKRYGWIFPQSPVAWKWTNSRNQAYVF